MYTLGACNSRGSMDVGLVQQHDADETRTSSELVVNPIYRDFKGGCLAEKRGDSVVLTPGKYREKEAPRNVTSQQNGACRERTVGTLINSDIWLFTKLSGRLGKLHTSGNAVYVGVAPCLTDCVHARYRLSFRLHSSLLTNLCLVRFTLVHSNTYLY